MKYTNYFLLVLLLSSVIACNDSDPVTELEPMAEVIVDEELTYTTDGGVTITFDEIEMHYDEAQSSTFVKYTNEDFRLRVNFRGRTTGVYDSLNGIFSKINVAETGATDVEIICDTYSGIVVTVDKYGEIGETIEGSFIADQCDGTGDTKSVSGDFVVIREE